jgi:hypothetical protein
MLKRRISVPFMYVPLIVSRNSGLVGQFLNAANNSKLL